MRNPFRTPINRLLFGSVCVLALLSACSSSDDQAPGSLTDSRSSLKFEACPVNLGDATAICGTLTVAENREKPESRLIGLPFAVFPSKGARPETDPIIYFEGGPGPSPLRLFEAGFNDFTNLALRKNRDVIVLNYRGTSLTVNGALDCVEVTPENEGGVPFASVELAIEDANQCKARLRATYPGIDFEQYTTENIARDHEDLRILLGEKRNFSKWNLFGVSYGTYLAQQYIRSYPAVIRSVVLDGPFSIQGNPVYGPEILETLTQVFDACRSVPACNAAYPSQLGAFAEAIERLEAQPVTVNGSPVSGHTILRALRRALPPAITPYGKVPIFVDKVIKGDLVGADATFSFIGFPEITITPATAFFTISCTDVGVQPTGFNNTPRGAENWPLRVRQIASLYQYFPATEVCPVWISQSAAAKTNKTAVTSNIPTFIAVGQFDINTPVANSDLILRSLSNSQRVVFIGRGHTLYNSDPCMIGIAAAFVNNPLSKVDSSCVDAPSSLLFE
jgi:pimeloyl-ACP methyl ester carboxylesterase